MCIENIDHLLGSDTLRYSMILRDRSIVADLV